MSKHSDIKKSLEEIFTEVQSKPEMNEDTLRIDFAKKKILENLGYTKNEIFYEERLSTAKRTDIHCTDEFGDVVFIIEFKNPKIENLKQFEDDLWKKYVKPLKAKHGLLYNGKEILFYERKRNQLQKISNVSGKIPDLDDNKISNIIQYLEKPDYGTTLIKNVTDYLNKFKDIDERLALEEEISREHFYESFKLKKDSIFTSLVCSIIDLFQDELKRKDKSFTRSAYDFWKKSYAKSLAKSQVPDNWKPVFKETSLSIGKEEDRYVMMFCLETAFALFMRLILTKSCEDFGFPDARFSDFLENEIKKASRSNRDIAQASYPKIAMEIIRDMKDRLISSVFEEDIFYWWTGEFDKRSYQRFFQDSTLQMGKFGRNVAKLLMSIYKFDFSKIEGDPLGVLYQQYFDTETRKALGEFYTPLEIVNYILDSVDYNGQKVINQRLLDPACGSGTFLVEALRRYLENSSRKANQVGWSKVLDDLCNEYLIVGFDIHPFATIMSQVQFTLALLPKYKLAKDKDPGFVLSRLPIFRTDSLSKEKQSGTMKIEEWGEGTAFTMKIELPVQKESDTFFEGKFVIPDDKTVFSYTDINTIKEYFCSLQAIFDSVKQTATHGKYKIDLDLLENTLQRYLPDKKCDLLAGYFEPHSNNLLEHIKTLKTEFDDGRLVKSIEDVMLAALLKNFVEYDYVVGNPPYVRVQDVPERQKNRWPDMYDWVDGNFDIFIPFIERGIKWIKGDHNGKLSYIVSNRFLLTNYGRKMRTGLPKIATIDKIVDLKDSRVFKDALNYPTIFVFSRGKSKKSSFPVARVFEDPDEGSRLLQDIENNFKKLGSDNDHQIGKYSDVFNFQYGNLRDQGWYLMPPDEWRIFTHIENSGNGVLEKYTKTRSGGFQGVSTSKDDVYVLKLIEERKDTIVVRPKGGGNPVEIEKDLLRPFLFGKDVGRWKLNWKGWYVLFPYKKYLIDDEERYKLIPSKQYKNKFDYGKRYIEDIFPKGWKYFESIESELRKREGGVFKKGKSKEYQWYGMTYPRSIDNFDELKFIIQVSSNEADMAFDDKGVFCFTGGGTSGVYGILPDPEKINNYLLLALLNSNIFDYYLKHVSTVYAGKSYSYGDQFIKLLPIKAEGNDEENKLITSISELAKRITSIEQLKQKIQMFPIPYFSKLRKDGVITDFFEIKHTTRRSYPNVNVGIQQDLEENNKITLGKDDFIDDYRINSDKKFEYVIMTINGRQFKENQEIIIQVPQDDKNIDKIMEIYNDDVEKLNQFPPIDDLEMELNHLAYDLYGLTKKEDIEVVENFLERF